MVSERSLTTRVRRMIFYRGDLDFVFFARFVDGTTGGRGQLHTPAGKRKVIIRIIYKRKVKKREKQGASERRKKKRETGKVTTGALRETKCFNGGASRERVNRTLLSTG